MVTGRRCFAASLCMVFALPLAAQQYPATMLSGLQWRDVGPMRGGRTYGVAGNASQPDTFYMGSVGGASGKQRIPAGPGFQSLTIQTPEFRLARLARLQWRLPIPTSFMLAPANPTSAASIRMASGSSNRRRGQDVALIGLAETRQVGKIVVDPADPNRVYVAALGHVYEANPDRGVYRSLDGGAHSKKVLINAMDPDNVGAIDLALDPNAPRTIYASLWATRRPPWAVYAPSNMPGGGLYKSTDGGDTWHQLAGGLPADDYVGKIGIAIAPSNPNRLYAVVDDLGKPIASSIRGGLAGEKGPEPKPSGGIYYPTTQERHGSW